MFPCQIRSDRDNRAKVEYFLTGKGADKSPYNLFVVDHDTGFVRITDKVDREKYPSYNVSLSLNKFSALYCTVWTKTCLGVWREEEKKRKINSNYTIAPV